jgi:fructan beta-fructosidase
MHLDANDEGIDNRGLARADENAANNSNDRELHPRWHSYREGRTVTASCRFQAIRHTLGKENLMKKLLLTVTCLSFTLCASASEPNNGNPHPENAQEITITGKYIIFPVSNRGQRGRMTITVGDQLVHHLDCDFPPSADAIDWWTYLDMAEYTGNTAKVVAKAAPDICALFESSDEIRHLQPLYDEALRPQFHMSQMRGWNNDPNGMCYYDGEYHFFWQCNPAGRNWANMYWGHATSPDMVHWTERDRALRSFGDNVENRHPKMADKNCFSGSGNVDLKNTAGWQTGDEKTIVLAFTDTGCGEALAYSTDRGKTFTYYENNPVIKHSGRDPKLMWYEPGQHWVIAVFDQDETAGRNIALYTSRNLKEW